MTTINKQISSSADDCFEANDTTAYTSSIGGYVGTNGPNTYDIGLRWQSIDIAQGADITTATLSLYAAGVDTILANIHAVNETNTAAWSQGSRPSQRAKTGTVSANPGDWGNWGVGNWITMDITTLIQAIVDQVGWSANNALAVTIDDNGSDAAYLYTRTYDYTGQAHGAKLDIVYGAAAGRTTKNSRQTMNVHAGTMFQVM